MRSEGGGSASRETTDVVRPPIRGVPGSAVARSDPPIGRETLRVSV